jgi:cytochrome c nitrite reductase small subunit
MKLGTAAWGLLGLSVGLALGGGGYTFIYAKGGSYLTDDPAACANCHIMQDHFDAWVKSSHRAVAVCNDCHTPSAFLHKYVSKADNGWRHSWAFTTGDFPDPLRQIPRSRAITEQACRKCHAEIVELIEGPSPHRLHGGEVSCIRCHRHVGHPL